MMQRIRERLLDLWSHRREIREANRCGKCGERYVGLAQDCACTNWGGFIGI